jgi:hypothetical protein
MRFSKGSGVVKQRDGFGGGALNIKRRHARVLSAALGLYRSRRHPIVLGLYFLTSRGIGSC